MLINVVAGPLRVPTIFVRIAPRLAIVATEHQLKVQAEAIEIEAVATHVCDSDTNWIQGANPSIMSEALRRKPILIGDNRHTISIGPIAADD